MSSSCRWTIAFLFPPHPIPPPSLIIKYSSHVCLYLVVKYGLSLFKRISFKKINKCKNCLSGMLLLTLSGKTKSCFLCSSSSLLLSSFFLLYLSRLSIGP